MRSPRLRFMAAVLVVGCGASAPNATTPEQPSGPAAPSPAAISTPETAHLASVTLECELTKTDGACNQAKPKTMSVTVDKVNSCSISTASHELSLTVEEESPSARDGIRVRVPGYPNATGNYTINAPNLVALYEGGGSTASNGAAPHGAGSECSNDCTVGVRESADGVRKVALDVSCKELCIPNECLRCKSSGGNVAFKLAVDCP